MKIIVICPIKKDYKDDTDMFCEGFEKLGHKVIRIYMWIENGKIFSDTIIDKEDCETADVIWAPYEPLIYPALKLKEDLKIPVVGHLEIIPQQKYNLENYDNHWYTHISPPTDNNYRELERLLKDFLKCDVKSITGPEVKYRMERFLGRILPLNFYIKPYPLDSEMLEKYKKELPLKNQILTIDTLVPYKRIQHIVIALSLLKNPPKYIIVGKYHTDVKQKIMEFAKTYKLDIELKGIIGDEEKCHLIQESLFLVEPMSCLTVTEGAYYKKASICYDEHIMHERLADMPFYTPANDIPKLANSIKILVEGEIFRDNIGNKAYSLLMTDKTNTHTLEKACKIVEVMFKEAVERYKK